MALPERLQTALADLRSGTLSPAALSQHVAAVAAERVRESTGLGADEGEEGDRRAAIETLHPLATSWCRQHLRSLAAALGEGDTVAGVTGADLAETTYLERLSHLVVECVLVNPAAPPLQVSPVPDARHRKRLATAPTVAVLFDYPLAITHELYPLWTDAFVFAQARPLDVPPLEVIGVHVSWLDADCRARRAIVYLPGEDVFVEAPCDSPKGLGAALLLAQSASCHRALAARLRRARVPHANEWPAAASADDKWECYRRWRSAGVATPPTYLLPRAEDATTVAARIGRFTAPGHGEVDACPGGWMIQPRHGTEGQGLSWVSPGSVAGEGGERLVAAWQDISQFDDAILRPAVGQVCLATTGESRSFDLRLHVTCDGERCGCESGYLLVAPASGCPISSVARGGSIRPWTHLQDGELVLVGRGRAARALEWGARDLDAVRTVAAAAVAAVGPLALSGVDLKLDWRDGSMAPSVIDLNPRPAGLLHSDLLASDCREAGISSSLWRYLGRLVAGGP